MTPTLVVQVVGVVLTAIGILVVPLLVIIAKSVLKITQLESKLEGISRNLGEVADGLDRRLRWLEERIWGKDAVRH